MRYLIKPFPIKAKMDPEQVEAIINAVEKRKSIYDETSPEYNNIIYINNDWKKDCRWSRLQGYVKCLFNVTTIPNTVKHRLNSEGVTPSWGGERPSLFRRLSSPLALPNRGEEGLETSTNKGTPLCLHVDRTLRPSSESCLDTSSKSCLDPNRPWAIVMGVFLWSSLTSVSGYNL